MQTQLLGQPVDHIAFGKGIITDISNKIITIHFSQGEKRFLYPEAFSHFLTLKDTAKQKEINAKYNGRLRAEKAARKKECEEQALRRQIRTMKITPNAQAVFDIVMDDAEKMIEHGSISTGCYLSGYSKGEPRIPNRLKPNSVCLLTGLPESNEERDRRILGAFMVKEDFWGKHCTSGIIDAHDEYRICLPSDIALSYWDYFEHNETLPRWGNVVFKYFSNNTMQKILLDIKKLLENTEQETVIGGFYRYFCDVNRLPLEQTENGETL
ncbi:MAG: hypothetical protein ACOX7K_05865 [Oscillospiraceae bacterium]|jgi:hypothetical protein